MGLDWESGDGQAAPCMSRCMEWCMAWCGGVELMWWYNTWIGEVGLLLFLSLVLLRLGGAMEWHNREILSGFILSVL